MMMTSRSLRTASLFLAAMLLAGACSLLDGDQDRHGITGQWQWLYSTGGIGGWTISPDSAGYGPRRLVFGSGYTFASYHADTLRARGAYVWSRHDEISYHTADDYYQIPQRVRFIGRDTLVLLDRCADCFRHVYRRRR